MPKLRTFAVCQKVIIDQEENLATLVALIDRLTVTLSHDEAAPALIPARWSAFSYWKYEDGDYGKRYEQRIRVCTASGIPADTGEGTMDFEFIRPRVGFRCTFVAEGFPAAAGEYFIELSMREVGTPEWKSVARYAVSVDHKVAPPP